MMDRRLFLQSSFAGACSAAAHPLLSTAAFASAPNGGLGENRLVVIILRGAMDGLDLLRPYADSNFAGLRPTLAPSGQGQPLDGFFWLHPEMASLMPLWEKGQLGFVNAVSSPFRGKRSHFEGQDILEAGTGMDLPSAEQRDGWLNRMLQAVPGLRAETAYAVGIADMPILRGAAPYSSWAPEQSLDLSAASKLLLERVYENDPLFHAAASQALAIGDFLQDQGMQGNLPTGAFAQTLAVADFAIARLLGETRIATFSIDSWDTHKDQSASITKPLGRLAQVIMRMSEGLQDVWGKTLVVAMTEFGRTARENGTRGTDHGTGSAMILAGGALRGGQVYGAWPGLAEADLLDRRDLMPTSDVRSWAGHALRGLYGFDKGLIENTIFPGLQLPDDPKILL